MECLGPHRSKATKVVAQCVLAPAAERPADGVWQLERHEQPDPLTVHPSATNSLLSRCMATVVDRSRMSARLPGSRAVRVIRSPDDETTEKHTIPTGFSSEAPSGPAMPVIPSPKSAPRA